MTMLSDLLRFRIQADVDERVRLEDLAIDLADCHSPLVTRIYLKLPDRRQILCLPGSAIVGVKPEARSLALVGVSAAQPAPAELPESEVLLKRDVLDALVLDLLERRATRASDLWLDMVDGRLRLCAADTSGSAVVRRLIRRPRHTEARAVSEWKYIQFLRGDPALASRSDDCVELISRLPPGEIARLSNALPYPHASELLTLLPPKSAADALEAMPDERQLQVFEELAAERGDLLLTLMRPDVAADLIGALAPKEARRYLERLPDGVRERVIGLLRYPEDSVGGIMTNDLVVAPENTTVEEALPLLRERLREPDFVSYIYIVDNETDRHLRGILTLRDLIIASPQARLGEIMNPYVLTLLPLEAARPAAWKVLDSELAALPVIDGDGRLRGAVAIDSAMAEVMSHRQRREVPRIFT